jgi:catechol 2,3-dioxygenase-like lactoylglutathione lyase family enzyme
MEKKMSIHGLDHFSIITNDLERTTQFYCDIIGLEKMPGLVGGVTRGINYRIPGSEEAIVHIIDADALTDKPPRDSGFFLHGEPAPVGNRDFLTRSLEHICFRFDADDFDQVKIKLKKYNYEYREGFDFMPKFKQIWVIDPNGVKIELVFFNN